MRGERDTDCGGGGAGRQRRCDSRYHAEFEEERVRRTKGSNTQGLSPLVVCALDVVIEHWV